MSEFVEPLGMRVLVRKDESRQTTKGGIVLPDDAVFFLDCLDGDRDSDVPVTMGARAVETILAAYEAAAG